MSNISLLFGLILFGFVSHATTAYLLCDNDITNKPELSAASVNCTRSMREHLNTEVAVTAAIFSRRTLSLDGFGYKCSGYFIQSEHVSKQHVVSLNLTELECKIMALIHTFTTESGRKLALLCNSHATRCLFKDDDDSRSNQTASKNNNKRRYFLMMTRVELKSNSRGHLVHREEVFDECHVEDKSCRVDGTLYVWDSNIIQSDGLVLLDHGLYVHSQASRLIYTSSNENTTASFLFFITDEFVKLDSSRYWLTSSGLYVLMRNESEDAGRFESIVDESRVRSNVGVVVGLNQLEMERLNDAKQAYQLYINLRGSIDRNEEEHERQKCILYQNQLNLMSASTANNYFKFEMLDGTEAYVYVVNGRMFVTRCEPLLSVSEAVIETQEGESQECFKYRPVAVYDMKFNRFQAYLFNSLYVNSHPNKIRCV